MLSDVIAQLADLGLAPEEIDTVISTHYDIDHAGRHGAFTRAQYVVQRLHHTDALTVDAVPFAAGFTRDEPDDDGSSPDAAATRASTIKLLDLVDREQIGLVIFGHDPAQWETLKLAPDFYA